MFEQLFFHASGLGVAFGNAGYFRRLAPEQVPLAIDRYGNEAQRLIGLLNALLANQAFVAGDALSIADIAHFGWLWRREFAGVSVAEAPHVQRYIAELESLSETSGASKEIKEKIKAIKTRMEKLRT